MIRVGIGSWADAEYTGVLYPKGTAPSDRLAAYARALNHVEVNSSYYATPKRPIVAGWVKRTPADFTFSVKLHRAFSQSPAKTARESELPAYLRKGVEPLLRAKRLLAFFIVLPPKFEPGRNRLDELDALREALPSVPLAVELRHSGWVQGRERTRTLEFFRDRGLTWVAVDMPQIRGSTIMPPVYEVTNPRLAYVRLHGRNAGWLKAKSAAERHVHDYTAGELRGLGARVRRLAGEAENVLVIANNHARDFAPRAALALRRLLKV
ncbi:MAG TPA: DUF72 domain-containing protein [Opitutaceae bacterium]|nr:DUF72 domain-containing protein [Opitutaceae bacterium]